MTETKITFEDLGLPEDLLSAVLKHLLLSNKRVFRIY